MSKAIITIVEGHGEVEAVSALLGKLLKENPDVHVGDAVRQHRQRIVRSGELERAVELAIRTRNNVGGVLILLDADKDCPATLAAELLERAQKATNLPVAVVLAKKEFENWFIGSLESFRGFMGIPEEIVLPENPEEIGGKGRLEKSMSGTKYAPSIHQIEFVRKMDFDLCRNRCPSFNKFLRDVERLVQEIKRRASEGM